MFIFHQLTPGFSVTLRFNLLTGSQTSLQSKTAFLLHLRNFPHTISHSSVTDLSACLLFNISAVQKKISLAICSRTTKTLHQTQPSSLSLPGWSPPINAQILALSRKLMDVPFLYQLLSSRKPPLLLIAVLFSRHHYL